MKTVYLHLHSDLSESEYNIDEFKITDQQWKDYNSKNLMPAFIESQAEDALNDWLQGSYTFTEKKYT